MSSREGSTPSVGIDLGTTYSVVATLDSQGRPVTIQNAEGDATTPSVVLFEKSGVVVGKEAVKLASYEPDAVAAYAKRDIGTAQFGRPLRGTHLPPEVVQSLVLAKLCRDAAAKLGSATQAVITVPAYFNEPRRKATQDAGHLAGIEVLDIINEPTAAAIAYGVEQGFLSGEGAAEEAQTVLVYDLGGGTFDVTVMRLEGHDYTALATAGDVYLGGLDWDRRIIDFVATRFMEEHGGLDPREDPAALIRLSREAEDAKRSLSASTDVNITFEFKGRLLRVPFSRRKFEELTKDLLERTRFTTRTVLKDAGVEWNEISRLLLVGGSSRMPMVADLLEEESGLVADRSLKADEAVAHGAAIYAGFLLSGKSGTVRSGSVGKITNVSSHDLGVLGTEPATGRPRRKVLVPRNTALPVKVGGRFATAKQGQKSVVVNVIEGGDDSGQNATAIGVCKVIDLPLDLPKHTPINVIFTYEANGRLKVRARLPDAGRDAEVEINRESGLTPDELKMWATRIQENQLLPEVVDEPEDDPDDFVAAVFEEPGEGSEIFDVEAVDSEVLEEEYLQNSSPSVLGEDSFPGMDEASDGVDPEVDSQLGDFLQGLE